MKKLMIAFAAVAMAAVAQASCVNWYVEGVEAQGSAYADDYVTYFFVASDSSSTYSTWSMESAIAAAKAKNVAALEANQAVQSALTYDGSVTSDYTPDTLGAGAQLDVYAIIFNASDASEATHFAVLGADAGVTPEAQGAYSVSFEDPSTWSTAYVQNGSWQSVPEPTSGLLLLLGVAGLALRRRRA